MLYSLSLTLFASVLLAAEFSSFAMYSFIALHSFCRRFWNSCVDSSSIRGSQYSKGVSLKFLIPHFLRRCSCSVAFLLVGGGCVLRLLVWLQGSCRPVRVFIPPAWSWDETVKSISEASLDDIELRRVNGLAHSEDFFIKDRPETLHSRSDSRM